MEFHEKLQRLRKERGLTQEALAASLYVSRAAISKWESGRGYPSIDSLKAIAVFFSVTVDDLLSGDEILTLAKEAQNQQKFQFCSWTFALLDLSVISFFFLPFFGQTEDGAVRAVSLLSLYSIAPYMKAAYWIAVVGIILCGLLGLILQWFPNTFRIRSVRPLSLLLHTAGVFLFIIGSQPYAAAFLFVFLIIKAFFLAIKQ